MTATLAAPAPTDGWAARRAAREAELLASFDPHVPGMNPADDGLVLFSDQSRGLTYRWWNMSRRTQDFSARESGYIVSQVSVTYRTSAGQDIDVARLNITHTTKELLADEFPTIFHWAEENTGASFGFSWKPETVTDADIWAASYTHLSREIGYPPSMDGQHCWSAFSASEAPTDPTVLAAEIAVAARHYEKMQRGFLRCLSTPFVDYSHVDTAWDGRGIEGHPGELRGTGVGRMMYLLAAQHLAKTGKVLRASGLQSEDAQRMWDRLAADPTVPTRKTRMTFWKPCAEQTKTYLCLDYTKAI